MTSIDPARAAPGSRSAILPVRRTAGEERDLESTNLGQSARELGHCLPTCPASLEEKKDVRHCENRVMLGLLFLVAPWTR
jgi:hypothetical protein